MSVTCEKRREREESWSETSASSQLAMATGTPLTTGVTSDSNGLWLSAVAVDVAFAFVSLFLLFYLVL